MDYVLHYAPDNASLIIRLALEELNAPYQTVLVDRSVTAQRSAAYRAINPAGRIPTLETPQGPISETGAILLWLGDRHGALVPGADAPLRGAFLNWLFFVANTLHPDLIASFYTHRYGPGEAIPQMRDALRSRILGHLNVLEKDATARLPGWFCGQEPSALDLYLAAILRWVYLYPDDHAGQFSLSDFPRLAAMCEALERRASVQALIKAEGLGPHPFTRPVLANPPEGVAL